MTVQQYPYRARWAVRGNEVGCRLCPAFVQRTTGGSIEDGVRDHLQVVHTITKSDVLARIVADTVRGRPEAAGRRR